MKGPADSSAQPQSTQALSHRVMNQEGWLGGWGCHTWTEELVPVTNGVVPQLLRLVPHWHPASKALLPLQLPQIHIVAYLGCKDVTGMGKWNASLVHHFLVPAGNSKQTIR